MQALIADQNRIKKDVDNLLACLSTINQLEMEAWKIYYGCMEITRTETIKNEQGEDVYEKVVEELETPLDPKTKLDAWEKIRQCNLDRAKLLQLLNPTQVTVEKMIYINQQLPVFLNKVLDLTLQYVPIEKQGEFLNQMEQMNMEGQDGPTT